MDVRQVDHPFGGGGGVRRWRFVQNFCGPGVEGMEPAGGLDVAQSGRQSLPDGSCFSPLHLDFTPDGQVPKITRIGFPGPVGRLECFLEFALIQQNFGQASIGGARWIRQLLQRGNSLWGSPAVLDHCFGRSTWIEAFEGDVGLQRLFQKAIGVGCKGPFPPEFRLIRGLLEAVPTAFHSLQSRPGELFHTSWPIWSRGVQWLLTARLGCRDEQQHPGPHRERAYPTMKGFACLKTRPKFPEIFHWQGGLAGLDYLCAD